MPEDYDQEAVLTYALTVGIPERDRLIALDKEQTEAIKQLRILEEGLKQKLREKIARGWKD